MLKARITPVACVLRQSCHSVQPHLPEVAPGFCNTITLFHPRRPEPLLIIVIQGQSCTSPATPQDSRGRATCPIGSQPRASFSLDTSAACLHPLFIPSLRQSSSSISDLRQQAAISTDCSGWPKRYVAETRTAEWRHRMGFVRLAFAARHPPNSLGSLSFPSCLAGRGPKRRGLGSPLISRPENLTCLVGTSSMPCFCLSHNVQYMYYTSTSTICPTHPQPSIFQPLLEISRGFVEHHEGCIFH